MYITHLDELSRFTGPLGKTVVWLLSEENGTPNFEMRYFEVPKGVSGIEEHHPFEHEVFQEMRHPRFPVAFGGGADQVGNIDRNGGLGRLGKQEYAQSI